MFSQGKKTPTEQNASRTKFRDSALSLLVTVAFTCALFFCWVALSETYAVFSCGSVAKAGCAAGVGGSEAIAEQSGAAGRPPLVTRGEQL